MINEMYYGHINFRGDNFVFTFNEYKLRLIPEKNNIDVINKYLYKEINKGCYISADPIICNDPFLKATTSMGQTIIFIPTYSYLGIEGNVLVISIEKIILFKGKESKINKIKFSCSEINYIFKSNEIINKKFDRNILSLDLKSGSSEKEKFNIDGNIVNISFGCSSKISFKVNDKPLDINSTLNLEFEPTNDYKLINRIINKISVFIGYLCNRRNIIFNDIHILSPYSDESSIDVGNIFVQNSFISESNTVNARCIHYEYIKGHIGDILQDIVDDNLYTRHISKSFEDDRHIDAAGFVLNTACFEWTFKKLYPHGLRKNKMALIAEEEVVHRLDIILGEEETTGKKRKLYKMFKNSITFYSLSSEIEQVVKDYKDIIFTFSRELERLNEGYDSKEIGNRLSEQRNNYAHGNLDKSFIC